MDLGLTGKRALVTGSSKGIGRAVAQALAQEGCHLELVARNRSLLEQVAESIQSECDVEVGIHTADLSEIAEQSRIAEKCRDVSIVVNNAGANPPGEIDEIGDPVWRAAWDLKVFGYINLTRHFYQHMKARKSGVIVNVIGTSGERMQARYILGSTGNIALMGLTKALGAASTDYGVRVVGVNPGLTRTDRAEYMLKGWSENAYGTPDRWREFQGELNLPFGRMGEPTEVADMVVFLASDRAAYVSGTVVTVDGGATNRNI
tara:strand:+ start:1509 stop:2291 length:783 start_codon:yes stop_codon:yes gene_type:complete